MARRYDPYIARFVQADSIVLNELGGISASSGKSHAVSRGPLTVNLGEFVAQSGETDSESNAQVSTGNPQALNRYGYGLNNALRYTDPTGHCIGISVILISGLIGGAASAGGSLVAQVVQGSGTFSEKLGAVDWGNVGIAAGVGFAAGALAPVVATTTAAAALLGSGAGIAQYGLTQWSNDESVTAEGVALSGAIGGVLGAVGGTFNPQPGGRLLTGAGQQWSEAEARAINSSMQVQYELLSTENLVRSGWTSLADNWEWGNRQEEAAQ